MNKRGVSLWGFVGTVVLTTLMAGSQGLGLSRINFPFMLGTMFTPNRDRAKLIGFGVHFLNGWIFASVYAAAFESWRRATWWLGGAIGLVHALYVLVAAMPALPAMHPRMASEQDGPTPTKQLEPPGFMALNYCRQTQSRSSSEASRYGRNARGRGRRWARRGGAGGCRGAAEASVRCFKRVLRVPDLLAARGGGRGSLRSWLEGGV